MSTVGTRLSWDGGLALSGAGAAEFDPPVATPPTPFVERVIKAFTISSVTFDGTDAKTTGDVAERPRAPYRILVGGKDVTYFRGVQTPFPGYGLEAPLLYGSGMLVFPQIHAAFERPGHGELSWLKKFSTVRVQRVDPDDGHVTATDYRGFISDFRCDGRTFSCTLGGEATGRAAMQDRPLPIFPHVTDIGGQVMQTIQHQLRLPTANQPTTGIEVIKTGGGSQLDWIAETLAKSTERDGTQWTVMPNSDGAYRMFQKDLTTIDATVYIDGFRVEQSLRRDFTEEPNRVWAQGIDQEGRRQRFAIYPGLQNTSLAYPGSSLSAGDSGDNVTALLWRLYTIGALDEDPTSLSWTTDSDDPVTEAVKDVQADNGLTESGVVNAATWRSIFRGDDFSLRHSKIKPAAKRSYTEPYLMDATGNIIGKNPNYDRSRPLVDVSVDMGAGFSRRQIKKWAQRELANDTSNWVGTITVNTGAVIDGEFSTGGAPLDASDLRDARSIKPGMNLWLPNWDGGTLIHVSGVTVSDTSVEYAVDTRARDTMKVWEVIHRNRESRRSPSRQWIAQNRRSGIRDDSGAFYDGSVFGKIPRTFCPADEYTVIPTPGGRSGIINLLDIQTTDAEALFGLSIWGRKVTPSWLTRHLGDPFGAPFANRVRRNTKDWQDNKGLVNVWGQKDQPCGYWPDELDVNAVNVVTQAGASVVASTDVFTLSHHGYQNGDQVYFASGSLPAGLTANNDYFVIARTLNTFKVSATKGGSAMNITADRSGIAVSTHESVTPDVTGRFRDKSGFPYLCQGSPVLWIAIYPDRDTYVQGGRVLDLLLDDGAS